MKHQYTVELLFHFNCGTCQNWWSYATTPDITYMRDLEMPSGIDYYCPHCGVAEKVELKKNFEKNLTS